MLSLQSLLPLTSRPLTRSRDRRRGTGGRARRGVEGRVVSDLYPENPTHRSNYYRRASPGVGRGNARKWHIAIPTLRASKSYSS